MAVRCLAAALCLFLGAPGCGGGEPTCVWAACACPAGGEVCADTQCVGAAPAVSPAVAVVPSDGLPAGLALQDASNNLDVIVYDGRFFLAFRTAPSHFASALATLHVVSSCDEVTWEHEWSFNLQTDLREPRLLSFGGRLFLYFAVLGDNQLAFEPQGMMVTERRAGGTSPSPSGSTSPSSSPGGRRPSTASPTC
jgi:hypothetical protein